MSLTLIGGAVQNADLDLTSPAVAWTGTPHASYAKLCRAYVALGDGVKNLDGTGATTITLTLAIGSQTGPVQTYTLASGVTRGAVVSEPFVVPANTAISVSVSSSNGSDSDVDVTAGLYEGSASSTQIWAEETPVYTAVINYTHKGTATPTDYYTVNWRRNGVLLTAGITSPAIAVDDRSSGASVPRIAATAMTDQGSGDCKFATTTAGELLVAGVPYEVTVTATIDGATRTFSDNVSRDI